MNARIELRFRPMWKRVLNAPRVFVRFFRIVPDIPIVDRLRFAAWETFMSVKGF